MDALRWTVTVIVGLPTVGVVVWILWWGAAEDLLVRLVLLGFAGCLLAVPWGLLVWWWTGQPAYAFGLFGPLIAFGLFFPLLDEVEGRSKRIWR